MKKFRFNAGFLIFAACLLAFNFSDLKTSAQTKSSSATKNPSTKKAAPKPSPSPTQTAKSAVKSKTANAKTANAKTSRVKNASTNAKNAVEKNQKTSAPKEKANSAEKKEVKKEIIKETANAKPSDEAKTAAKPPAKQQIITTVTAGRVRAEPNAGAKILKTLNLGSVLNVSEKNGDWQKVEFETGKNGWISKTIVADFGEQKRTEIYQKIAAKHFKNERMDFKTAAEVFNFLKTAEAREKNLPVDLKFKRLLALRAALKAVPFDKTDENPYKAFLDQNEKEIVYSEPSGEWYVRSDVFWELHAKNAQNPIAEEIARQAANNTLPGECEGYVNCYLYKLRATEGEYLNFYPNGKYTKTALENLAGFLDPLAADAQDKKIYYAPTDISDRAEFNRLLTELRAIVSKSPRVEKNRPLQQIKQIGEGYR